MLAGSAVSAATESLVKITGVATECRRGQEGSGWVVAKGRVVTNAHVVAGVDDVVVRVKGTGPSLHGTVVVFDPERDLAVIAVPDLQAAPSRWARRSGEGLMPWLLGSPSMGRCDWTRPGSARR